jgi:hypothetical protein
MTTVEPHMTMQEFADGHEGQHSYCERTSILCVGSSVYRLAVMSMKLHRMYWLAVMSVKLHHSSLLRFVYQACRCTQWGA